MASKPKSATTAKRSTGKAAHVTKGSSSGGTARSSSSGKHASSSKKSVTARKSAKTPAKLAGNALAALWVTGPGDEWPYCAPVAVANSLLAALGVRASNADLERLYRASGAHRGTGTPVEAVLAAAAETGLAGCRLASWKPVAQPAAGGLLLMKLDFTPDLHAAAYLGGGTVATWGDTVPLTDLQARLEGAWALSWHGKDA